MSNWFTGSLLASILTLPFVSAQDGKSGKAEAADSRSVDVHINDLRNGDIDTKVAAFRAIEALGPKAKAAVPDLIGAVQHPDGRVRYAAVSALAEIGPDAKAALPSLKLQLADATLKQKFNAGALIGAVLRISTSIDLATARA